MGILDDLKAPSVEVWERADGSWHWALVDTPNIMEGGGIVVFDSTPFPTAELALQDVDQLLSRQITEAGY